MSNTPESITLSVPASDIADIETFESLRTQAYKEEHDTASFTALAESTSLKNGESLFNQFEGVLEASDPSVKARQEAEARAARITKAVEGTVFYDLVLGTDAEVHDIFRHVKLPEDAAYTRAQHRMADQVPYGRKQNDSSFLHRPTSRRGH